MTWWAVPADSAPRQRTQQRHGAHSPRCSKHRPAERGFQGYGSVLMRFKAAPSAFLRTACGPRGSEGRPLCWLAWPPGRRPKRPVKRGESR